MIELTADEQMKRVNAILTAFPDKIKEVYNKGIRAGLNKADSAAMKEIPKTYAISKANLNDKNYTRKRRKLAADRDIINGTISYSGYRFPLYRFDVSPRLPQRINGKSAPVRAKQLIDGNFEPWITGFIAKMKSGHIGVFKRVGGNSYPIREAMGASVQEMVNNTVVLDKVEAESYDAVAKAADKQIQLILEGR